MDGKGCAREKQDVKAGFYPVGSDTYQNVLVCVCVCERECAGKHV